MTITEILKRFEGKAPPWGDKLTPTAFEELKKAIESLCLLAYQDGLSDGYKEGYKAAEMNTLLGYTQGQF